MTLGYVFGDTGLWWINRSYFFVLHHLHSLVFLPCFIAIIQLVYLMGVYDPNSFFIIDSMHRLCAAGNIVWAHYFTLLYWLLPFHYDP